MTERELSEQTRPRALPRVLAVLAVGSLLAAVATVAWALGVLPGGSRGTTVLVMGSDSREGDNAAHAPGDDDSERADSIVLVHLAEDGGATVVSLPRDTVVERPECEGTDGGSVHGSDEEPLNQAFAIGGAECAVAAVERTTGVPVDHHAVLDFVAMSELSTLVGGVEVTVPEGIEPGFANGLEPGRQVLAGDDAVAFLRLRHVGEDQSDLRRIERQQEFLRGLVAAAGQGGLLSDPARAVELASEFTERIETDPGLANPMTLGRLLNEHRGIAGADVEILTAPVVDSEVNPLAWVEFSPDAKRLWRRLGA
ncbi:LCP family protein [Nocardiopsis exhalans]|uniref:LCP family protein n=1 Tax=Nocardiopsis exhalans TaxID=163604 RepID=A0ABY5DB48_9ACTN|nr:LCP family protein [Nocardiopsis exhalans]USY21247.1 LCP family protein [Nocardiopsis exhalans]